jgi:iron complex transport system permease protein
MFQSKTIAFFLVLLVAVLVFFTLNIATGQVYIPFSRIPTALFANNSQDSLVYIIQNYRFPKAITAVLVGVGLSVSGLLMQTFFRNPLAGPYILGLSSGSSLGVALLILGSGIVPTYVAQTFTSTFGIVLASCTGSILVLLLVILASNKVKDVATILIIGMMFSSFAGALVNVLSYFSSAEQLQKFTFWNLGNLGNLSWNAIAILTICVSIGLFFTILSLKSLDALLLGENYAKSMGINIQKTRLVLLLATGILAGSITAFVGPIAFVGLAVPHLAKLLFQTSNHKILLLATALMGAILMLACDTVAQMPGFEFTLPINAVTSVVGAPIVIWLLLSKKRLV